MNVDIDRMVEFLAKIALLFFWGWLVMLSFGILDWSIPYLTVMRVLFVAEGVRFVGLVVLIVLTGR